MYGKNVKMEDFGKFYRYVDRLTKTIRNRGKMKLETFSNKNEFFHRTFLEKIRRKYMGKY